MPSIKKRVTGFIRQISSGPSQEPPRPVPISPPPQYEKCFIQRYLAGEERPTQPHIHYAKTGHGLPVVGLATLQPEVFAAWTGPCGGITCISRRDDGGKDGDPPPPSELDYIDLDDAGHPSRRASMAIDMIESFENGTSGIEKETTVMAPKENVVRVPKSPVYIDNTVMQIRVMDRVYRVDDSRKRIFGGKSPQSHPECPAPSWASCSSLSTPTSSSSSSSPPLAPTREAEPAPPLPPSSATTSSSALYQTSEIVDIDSQLDLIETEDGYLPAYCLPPADITPNRKRVTISSPVRSVQRPNFLNLSSLELNSPITSSSSSSSGHNSEVSSSPFGSRTPGTASATPLSEAGLPAAGNGLAAKNPRDAGYRCPIGPATPSNNQSQLRAGQQPPNPVNSHSDKSVDNKNSLEDSNCNKELSRSSQATGGRPSAASPRTQENPVSGNTKHEAPVSTNTKHEKPVSTNIKPRAGEPEYPELMNSQPGSLTAPSDSVRTQEEILNILEIDLKDDISPVFAGIRHWARPNSAAYGLSDSLYEKNPVSGEQAGHPIADTFAIIARKNSAIMVLGDGVNWGAKAALASRSAVYGAIEYLNQALFAVNRSRNLTTQDVFQILLRSFHAAHCLILEQDAMLTTLTAAVILPTKDSKFHLCVCNVGDSLAYVYSKGQVREVTQGSHDITANRDMRDALGALGPVDGLNPELSNLTCSLTEVLEGDIVFLTSDGISDNFDPVVGKFCVPKKPERNNVSGRGGLARAGQRSRSATDFDVLPVVEAFQRHELTLLRVEDILNHDWSSGRAPNPGGGKVESAADLCHRMLDFCQRLTTAKRKILEDPELYPAAGEDQDMQDQKIRRRKVCEKLAMVPGKLDHATITAYQVGDRTEELAGYTGDQTEVVGRRTPGPVFTAPRASCEDLTMRDSPEDEEDDDATPTPSISLDSTPLASGASSLAATPTHTSNTGVQ